MSLSYDIRRSEANGFAAKAKTLRANMCIVLPIRVVRRICLSFIYPMMTKEFFCKSSSMRDRSNLQKEIVAVVHRGA
jgi:hypothetical protein